MTEHTIARQVEDAVGAPPREFWGMEEDEETREMRRWQRWGLILTGVWALNIVFLLYTHREDWLLSTLLIAVTCAQNWAILYLLRGELDKL